MGTGHDLATSLEPGAPPRSGLCLYLPVQTGPCLPLSHSWTLVSPPIPTPKLSSSDLTSSLEPS